MRQRSGEVVGRARVVSFRFCFLFFIHNSCSLLSSVQRPALTVRRGPSVVGAAADSATQRWCGCRGARGGHTTAAHGRWRQAVRGVVRFLFVLLVWVQSHLTSCSSSLLCNAGEVETAGTGTSRGLDCSQTLAGGARRPRCPCGPVASPPRERGGSAYPAVPRPPGPLGRRERVARAVLVAAPLRATLATLSSSAGLHTTTGYDGEVSFCFTLVFGPISPDELLFFATADSATQQWWVSGL